jgi:hypothetical protein
VHSGTYLTVEALPLDSNYITRGLVTDLEQNYVQAAADFGMVTPPYARFQISPYAGGVYYGPEPDSYVIRSQALSLYADCCMRVEDTPTVAMYTIASQRLIGDTYSHVRGSDVPPIPFDAAILAWEAHQLGVVSDAVGFGGEKLDADTNVPRTLDALWAHDGWFDMPGYYDVIARRIGAYTLIDLLIEKYGIEVLPVLIHALPDDRERFTAMTIDDWLTSAGIERGQVEAEWLVHYDDLLRARGFVPEP